MTQLALKDFDKRESYSRLVEKKLNAYFWQIIYKPLFEIFKMKQPKAINSASPIIEAIKSGKIYFTQDGFKADKRFTNELSMALEKLGAKYDKYTQTYKILSSQVPYDILSAINEKKADTRQKINKARVQLSELEGTFENFLDEMLFQDEVITILDDAGNEVKKNAKRINVIEHQLSAEQKREIADTYTNNMRFYIQKWSKEEIPKMRRQVELMALKGERAEAVQKMLQQEYNVGFKKAKFLAQNETSIMLASFKKSVYTEMGFTKFIWNTIMDSKERPLHKELNGTTWSYDNPPVIDERTGERGLPGQTYNCRCEAIPIADDSIFDSPLQKFGIAKSESRIKKYLDKAKNAINEFKRKHQPLSYRPYGNL